MLPLLLSSSLLLQFNSMDQASKRQVKVTHCFVSAEKRKTFPGHTFYLSVCPSSGDAIMEADDRQETTVFTVQPSFHHRHSTN